MLALGDATTISAAAVCKSLKRYALEVMDQTIFETRREEHCCGRGARRPALQGLHTHGLTGYRALVLPAAPGVRSGLLLPPAPPFAWSLGQTTGRAE